MSASAPSSYYLLELYLFSDSLNLLYQEPGPAPDTQEAPFPSGSSSLPVSGSVWHREGPHTQGCGPQPLGPATPPVSSTPSAVTKWYDTTVASTFGRTDKWKTSIRPQ